MTDDDRVQCVRCGNYRMCKCFEPIKAAMSPNARPLELGRDLAELPQRCPAYSEPICTRCGMTGHRASQCQQPIARARASEATA